MIIDMFLPSFSVNAAVGGVIITGHGRPSFRRSQYLNRTVLDLVLLVAPLLAPHRPEDTKGNWLSLLVNDDPAPTFSVPPSGDSMSPPPGPSTHRGDAPASPPRQVAPVRQRRIRGRPVLRRLAARVVVVVRLLLVPITDIDGGRLVLVLTFFRPRILRQRRRHPTEQVGTLGGLDDEDLVALLDVEVAVVDAGAGGCCGSG